MNISISFIEPQTAKPRFCHLSSKTSEKINDCSLKNGRYTPHSPPREKPDLNGSWTKKGPFYTGNGVELQELTILSLDVLSRRIASCNHPLIHKHLIAIPTSATTQSIA